jgi:hypothetical protein
MAEKAVGLRMYLNKLTQQKIIIINKGEENHQGYINTM